MVEIINTRSSVALLERKERFSDLNESQKAFYLQVSTWCFDTLEKELSKNEIVSILETYISTRKRDELNGRDGNRRYALSTLSEDDYPKLKKIINDMIITGRICEKVSLIDIIPCIFLQGMKTNIF